MWIVQYNIILVYMYFLVYCLAYILKYILKLVDSETYFPFCKKFDQKFVIIEIFVDSNISPLDQNFMIYRKQTFCRWGILLMSTTYFLKIWMWQQCRRKQKDTAGIRVSCNFQCCLFFFNWRLHALALLQNQN